MATRARDLAAHGNRADNPHTVGAAQAGADPAGSAQAAEDFAVQRGNHTGTQTLATISDAGTAASKDTTTSTTDSTPGRLVRVEDFGIGTHGGHLESRDLGTSGATQPRYAKLFTLKSTLAYGYASLICEVVGRYGAFKVLVSAGTGGAADTSSHFDIAVYDGAAGLFSGRSLEVVGNYYTFEGEGFYEVSLKANVTYVSVQYRVERVQASGFTLYNYSNSAWADSAGENRSAHYAYNHKNVVGTVSQISGAVTGAIIEQGSNANGDYTKFADGTMICSGKIGLGPANMYGTGSLANLWRSDVFSRDLPAVFANVDSCNVSGSCETTGANRPYGVVFDWVSVSSIRNIQAYRYTDDSSIVTGHFTVIGRWL